MSRNRRHKKKVLLEEKPVTLCESCRERYCGATKQQECAEAEFRAIMLGDSYECTDRVPINWMEAA